MGDRAVIYVTGAACAVYLHWGGHDVPALLRAAARYMRAGDPDYATARLIGSIHAAEPGTCDLGVLPPPTEVPPPESYSHGDAGVYIVDSDTGETTAYHGYAASKAPFTLGLAR